MIGYKAWKGRLDQSVKQPLDQAKLKLTPVAKAMDPAFSRFIDKRRANLETQSKLLNSLSYKGVLSRGYAVGVGCGRTSCAVIGGANKWRWRDAKIA